MTSSGGTGVVTSRMKSFFGGISKEELKLKWSVENFKEAVAVSVARKTDFVEMMRFQVGGGDGREDVDPHGNQLVTSSSTSLAVKLSSVETKNQKSAIRFCLFMEDSRQSSTDLVIQLHISIVGMENPTTFKLKTLQQLTSSKALGHNLFLWSDVEEYLDEGGSLNLDLLITTFLASGQNIKVAVEEVDVGTDFLFEKYREGALKSVGSLLGDKKTSDIKISVFDGEKETGSIFCHTAILSARSSVFRAMFEHEMNEKREGVVKVEDVSVEVMDQFLTFVYSGRLKDKRKEGSVVPIWVKMLPQLVYTADKYDVGDLKEFCDAQFHRAVTKDNAVEMLQLARRHRLVRAEAKMRADLSKNVDVLLESLLK